MPVLTIDAVELKTTVGPHGDVLLPDEAKLLAHVDLLAPRELALAPPQGLNNLGLRSGGVRLIDTSRPSREIKTTSV